MELSQSDKRLCRELINTGLERECRRFVEQIQTIACEPIPPEQLDMGLAGKRLALTLRWKKLYMSEK